MTILLHPLYFVRSGNIGISSGRVWSSGYDGKLWSFSANIAVINDDLTPNAYLLYFSAYYVLHSRNYDRWDSFSLRCLGMPASLL